MDKLRAHLDLVGSRLASPLRDGHPLRLHRFVPVHHRRLPRHRRFRPWNSHFRSLSGVFPSPSIPLIYVKLTTGSLDLGRRCDVYGPDVPQPRYVSSLFSSSLFLPSLHLHSPPPACPAAPMLNALLTVPFSRRSPLGHVPPRLHLPPHVPHSLRLLPLRREDPQLVEVHAEGGALKVTRRERGLIADRRGREMGEKEQEKTANRGRFQYIRHLLELRRHP
jgi:hypothetical protein